MFRYVHEVCLYMYIKYVEIYTWSMFRYVHEVCLDMYMKYVEQYNMLIKFVFIISVYIHVIETLVAIALCNRSFLFVYLQIFLFILIGSAILQQFLWFLFRHQLGFSATLKWTLRKVSRMPQYFWKTPSLKFHKLWCSG